MKKFLGLSLMATMFVIGGVGTASAASWRVNSNTAMGADFADVNAAMSDKRVAAGDTLYLDPSTTISKEQEVTKQVTIVGPGYLHSGVAAAPAVFSKSVKISAKGTKFEGCTFESYVYMGADNITIERCYLKYKITYLNNSTICRNAVIHANYFRGNNVNIVGLDSSTLGQIFLGWVITNNIIYNTTSSTGINCITYLSNATIKNNVLIGSYYSATSHKVVEDITNSVITNNIIINVKKIENGMCSSTVKDGNTIENNVFGCDSTAMTDYPNNTFLNTTNLSTVFVNSGGNDLVYRLCEGSPAIGAGENGMECGAFAGDAYVPSGLPLFYPYFTGVEIPAVTTDGKLNIKLNIKTQNE